MYTTQTTGTPDDEANVAIFRADIHNLLDRHYFAIVPKPFQSSERNLDSSHPESACSFAFAAHVLKTNNEAREFGHLYHNVAISPSAMDRLRPEFLFARFARAVFAHLKTFFDSPNRRLVSLIVPDETSDIGSTELRRMNGDELKKYLALRGMTRSGSKLAKRSSSQMTEDDALYGDDAYGERWERRSRRIGSSDASQQDNDPIRRRIRREAQWRDEDEDVGRSARTREPRQEQIERNTRWYDEIGWPSRLRQSPDVETCEAETVDADTGSDSESDFGSDSGARRGRGGSRRLFRRELASSPPGSDGVPNLSRSFTTHGSARSSLLLESPQADHGASADFDLASPTLGDKVSAMAGEAKRTRHEHPHVDCDTYHC